jgi:hypothetical protein
MEPGDTEFEWIEASPVVATPRPGLLRLVWRGVWLGMGGMARVAVPLSAAVAILGLLPTALGLGAGRGLTFSKYPAWAVPVFFGLETLGAMLGAAFGLVVSLVRRVRPPKLRPASTPLGEAGPPVGVEVERRPSRVPAWAPKAGLAALLLLALAIWRGVSLGLSVDRRLADAIEAADRDDPNWRIHDLMAAREAVPDGENSAPVVAEVVGKLPENWPYGRYPKPDEPRPKNDLTEAFDRLQEAPDNARLADATADRLRLERDRLEGPIRLARTLAGYARGRHELTFGPNLYDTRLLETQRSRDAARLLQVDAALLAHDGRGDAALDSCRAVFGVGRSIGDEPFCISQLVRINEGTIGLKAARRALGQGEASDEALARLQALILDELASPIMFRGLEGDRALFDEMLRRIAAGEVAIPALNVAGWPRVYDGPPTSVASLNRLMFENQRAVGLELNNQLVAIARQPGPERVAPFEEWRAGRDRIKQDRFMRWIVAYPIVISPSLETALMEEGRYHAELGATAILLAAERHRLKTGDWPESIAAIDPALLPQAPVDPWTGLPFRYERRDGRLLVYSVGPNLKDEHGELVPSRWSSGGPDDCGTAAWDVPLRGRLSAPATEDPAQSSGQP